MPNNMVLLEENERVDLMPYAGNDDVETLFNALDVTIKKTDGESEFFPARALIGAMAERYSATNVRPSVMQNKHKQKVNYISTLVATAFYRVINKSDAMDQDIHMYIALPPVEVATAKDYVAKQLMGSYEVTFNKYMGGTTVKFKIASVSCREESFMAMVAFFFDKNGALKEEAKKYAKGNILSIDIGASTTDLAVVKDMRYLEKSGQTYKTGGNIAKDVIANEIRAMYGYDPTNEETEQVMAEGRLSMGNSFVEMTDSVNRAKKALAAQIMSNIQSYFRLVNIPIQTIRAIVVSGGGSMCSEYVDDVDNMRVKQVSKPTTDFIVEELKNICDTIDVVPFDGSPRDANITGLYIVASLDKIKRQRQAQVAANAQPAVQPTVQTQETVNVNTPVQPTMQAQA